MSVSIITTTASMGGLDMLFNSMAIAKARSDIPVEIILADEWYAERGSYVAGRTIGKPWNWMDDPNCVKHIPIANKKPYIDHSRGWNAGLRVAEGELVCFLNDYFWVYPDYIADHWRIYKDYPGYSMIGYCDRYPWPACKPSTRTEDVWWTAFNEEFTPERAEHFFQCTEPIYRERKGGNEGTEVPGCPYRQLPGTLFYASLNESIPMAVLKELGGWDERMDGGYSANDLDLGLRANLIGWKFLLNPTVNRKIGKFGTPRPVHTIIKPQLRTPEDNFQMLKDRVWAISQGQEPVRVPSGWGCWQ